MIILEDSVLYRLNACEMLLNCVFIFHFLHFVFFYIVSVLTDYHIIDKLLLLQILLCYTLKSRQFVVCLHCRTCLAVVPISLPHRRLYQRRFLTSGRWFMTRDVRLWWCCVLNKNLAARSLNSALVLLFCIMWSNITCNSVIIANVNIEVLLYAGKMLWSVCIIPTRKLPNTNTLCASIPVKKKFSSAGVMVDLVKFSSSLITMQNLVTVSHTACMHVKGSKKILARWYPVPLSCSMWLSSRNTPIFHLSYSSKLDRCRSEFQENFGTLASVGDQKFWGAGTPLP